MQLDMMQLVARMTAKRLGIKAPEIAVHGKWRRPRAYTEHGIIGIPASFVGKSALIMTYIVLHEVCHFIGGGLNHCKRFRENEDAMLQFWGISYKRKGHYLEDLRWRGK